MIHTAQDEFNKHLCLAFGTKFADLNVCSVIPGIVGPGILPPPPAAIEISLGFSANMPSITLDPQGNPSYPTEPTNKPTNGPTTSPSPTNSQSCTASSTVTDCTIETILYVNERESSGLIGMSWY